MALLQPADATEAWQMLQLHGTSVDLAVVHREGAKGAGEPGLEFVVKIKRDPSQADLPVVVSSEVWGDGEFAEHQRGPNGANAYLAHPYTEDQLVQLIEAVTGSSIGGASSAATEAEAPAFGGADSAAPEAEPALAFNTEDTSARIGAPRAFDPSLLKPAGGDAGFEASSAPAGQGPDALSMDAVEGSGSIPELPSSTMDIGGTVMSLSGSRGSIPTATGSAMGELDLDAPISDPEYLKNVEPLSDDEIAEDMPYLFGGAARGKAAGGDAEPPPLLPGGGPAGLGPAAMVIGQPVGDAVVPGGAAQSPDLETLKKYLLLREQDVAALSAQLRSARERVSSVEDVLRLERGRGVELTHVVEEQKKRIDDFEREKAIALEAVQGELAELKFEVKAKTDKTRVLELQVREATEEMERLRERVRLDIRKIRVREKELENRLEIMKKDSEALIGARENKIIELKRKLDLLEFNMDLLQDQYTREKENAARLRERLAKAAQVVRVAEGLLDQPGAAGAKAGAAGTEDAESKDKGERAAS